METSNYPSKIIVGKEVLYKAIEAIKDYNNKGLLLDLVFTLEDNNNLIFKISTYNQFWHLRNLFMCKEIGHRLIF